jgi:hypothetical protein
MKRTLALLPALALIAIIAATTMNTSSVSAGETSGVIHAKANGCDITIKARNESNRDLFIRLEESSVRTKQLVAGPWSTLDTKCPRDEMHLQPQADVESVVCEMDMTCNFQRQYKFKIIEKDNGRVINTQWVYIPANGNDWAESGKRTIDLGNIGRHF